MNTTQTTQPDNISPADIQPAADFARDNPHLFPNKNTLPWQLRNRNRNGLADAGAVLIINGKAYLHVPRYMQYLVSKAA